MISFVASPHVLFNIIDTIGTVSDAVDTVADIFADTGSWIAEVLDAGLSLFATLANAGIGKLGTSVDSSMFSDFFPIVNFVSSMFGVIGSSMLVFLFLYRLYSEISDGRSDYNIWMFVKSFAALGIGVALVGNSLQIVTGIFNAGAALVRGMLTYANANGASFDLSGSASLDDTTRERLIYGVTGLKGMLLLLVAIMAACVMIACGVAVLIEVYERIFTMFVLMPFAGLSFSFYAAPDFRGHEVFSGYVKSVLSVALESMIIVCVTALCSVLLSSGNTMSNLFTSAETDSSQVITIRNSSEMYAVCESYLDGYLYPDRIGNYCTWSDLSDQVLTLIEYDANGNRIEPDAVTGLSEALTGIGLRRYRNTLITIDGEKVTSSLIRMYANEAVTGTSFTPRTLVVYSDLSWLSTLVIMVRLVFPCILCAAVVKKSEQIAGKIIGR